MPGYVDVYWFLLQPVPVFLIRTLFYYKNWLLSSNFVLNTYSHIYLYKYIYIYGCSINILINFITSNVQFGFRTCYLQSFTQPWYPGYVWVLLTPDYIWIYKYMHIQTRMNIIFQIIGPGFDYLIFDTLLLLQWAYSKKCTL